MHLSEMVHLTPWVTMHYPQDLLLRGQQFADRVCQRILSIPSDLALGLSQTPWLQQWLLSPRYKAQLTRHLPHLPQLDPLEADIVGQLQRTGVAFTSLDALDLPGTTEFWHGAQQVAAELAARAKQPAYVHCHTLTATGEDVIKVPHLFWWGASPRLLRIVEAYLGLPAAYDGLSFYYSQADDRVAGPRKWHRDKEDWRMLKIAVYLHSVDGDGGPFESVLPNPNQTLRSHSPRSYPTFHHQQVKALLGEDSDIWRTQCTGAAGTVIFADTATYFHRGRPPKHSPRAAIFYGYFSQRPKHPFFGGDRPSPKPKSASLQPTCPPSPANPPSGATGYLPPVAGSPKTVYGYSTSGGIAASANARWVQWVPPCKNRM
ncbi:MAG: hypothetical protein HC919_01575 [Oscillatoriales cyanobacterium SM2_2_1]|nr:hypothetical protein [Oscillatoriales cyanobacterium SM2_2_1]